MGRNWRKEVIAEKGTGSKDERNKGGRDEEGKENEIKEDTT